jgi:hypothetical protein
MALRGHEILEVVVTFSSVDITCQCGWTTAVTGGGCGAVAIEDYGLHCYREGSGDTEEE